MNEDSLINILRLLIIHAIIRKNNTNCDQMNILLYTRCMRHIRFANTYEEGERRKLANEIAWQYIARELLNQ